MVKILPPLAIPFYIRAMLHRIITLLSIVICSQVCAQPYIDNVPQAFKILSEQPKVDKYESNIAGIKGGHLQGIQLVPGRHGLEMLLTASGSSHSSYYLSVTSLSYNLYTHTILQQPYRHAGGCQAAGNVWAVGVEDNITRNKSKVLLLSTDTNAKPITIAERSGTYGRSTSGATGLVRLKDGGYLVAVGDWDSKNIDFYMSGPSNVAAFDSVGTYKADTISTWGSYQSINLLQQTDGKLYMIGFCLDAKGSRADLFSISVDGGAKLQVVASRHFKTSKGVSFRYGAGLYVATDKQISVIACARTLKKGKNYINVWL